MIRQSGNGASTHYQYDSAARITSTRVTVNNTEYVTSTEYDALLGRPTAMTYPTVLGQASGLKVAYLYNDAGYLTHEQNAQSGFVYRRITEQDALGNITEAWFNNNELKGEYDYHHVTGQMLSSKAGSYHDISYSHNNGVAGYDSYGNLTAQRNLYSGSSESYSYDDLHRLTSSTVSYGGGNNTLNYRYDAVGNFTNKSDYSTWSGSADAYSYVTGSNKIKTITLADNSSVTFGYDNAGNQTHRNGTEEIEYNAFNKPTRITKNSQDITLSYGADIMRYKQERVVNGETIITWYIGKHFEIEERDSFTNYRHFISDAAIVDLYDTQVPKIAFTHKDRLGSTVTMTDENNNLTSMRHFDPFGKPRGGDWALIDPPQFPFNIADNRTDIRRGFTDHEHLDEAELIHMNGRVYDYNVGRFMSVDPVIQETGNSQNINPYSYLMNNPLSGTDPSGYSKISDDIKLSKGASNFSDHSTPANPSTEDKNKWAVIGAGITNINRGGNKGGNNTNNGAKTNVTIEGDKPTVDTESQDSVTRESQGDTNTQAASIAATAGTAGVTTLGPIASKLTESNGIEKIGAAGLGRLLVVLSAILETGSTPGAGINIYPETISQAKTEELVRSIRGAVNLDTGTIRALASGNPAVVSTIIAAIGNRHILVTPPVVQELAVSLSSAANRENYIKVAAIMARAKLINVPPSPRVMALPTSRRIGANDKVIFGVGDALGITTFTSDAKFVSVAANRGVVLNAFVHEPASY